MPRTISVSESPARVVRRLSGQAGGWRSPRRGSILVIVLGTLALLSVLTLIYVSLGRSDTRGSAVVVQRSDADHAASAVGEYIADIIARDPLATFVDPASEGNVKLLVRESTDYPYTDPGAISDPNIGQGLKFNPVGDHADGSLGVSTDPDYRPIPSDPYLAASTPSWLVPDPVDPPAPRWSNARDWAHITNIAPDGRYVNIYALRNNFDAKPGVRLAGSEALRLSDAVWLFNDNGARPGSATPPGPGNSASPLPFGIPGNADRNIPAHWGMYQQHAFRPIRDIEFGPGDWRYLGYTWADTDGDGLADARWQELVDASDPDNPKPVLGRKGPFRWFVAARIVDLSARVNVNTATEFRDFGPGVNEGEPTKDAPAGLMPSEIDLRRLLTLVDVYTDDNMVSGIDERGYKELLQPAPPVGGTAFDNYTAATQAIAFDAGRGAYNALKAAMLLGEAPPKTEDVLDEQNAAKPWFTPYDADLRVEQYLKSGAHRESAGYYADLTNPLIFEVGGLSDQSDLVELLTFDGVNNSASLSRLEQIMGGRGSLTLPNSRFSPLRDNRGVLLERDDQRLQITAGGPTLGQAEDRLLKRVHIDVRSKLTTVSGARPIAPRIMGTSVPNQLQADVSTLANADARIDAMEAIKSGGAALFRGYAAALVPYAGLLDIWAPGNPDGFDTLSYGRNPRLALRIAGHLAANMADLADRDGGTGTLDKHEPRKFTLRLTESVPNPLPPEYNGVYLDLGNQTLDTQSGGPNLINLYGIEAQPFIAEAVSLYVYRDTPAGEQGDDEVGVDDPPIHPEITIDTTLQSDNKDLLLQLLAFQITNPFDAPLGLSKADTAAFPDGASVPAGITDYYVEIGDRKYDLVDIDPLNPTTRKQVVLKPGETRVFYALCDNLSTLANRWPGNSGLNPMLDFIENQLTLQVSSAGPGPSPATNVAPLLTHNPVAGTNSADIDLLPGVAFSRDVTLKRVIGDPALLSRHLVADRLNDPDADATLKRIVTGKNEKIAGTEGGPDGTNDNDGDGFTIALWGRIKRHDYSPAGGPLATTRGFIPPWCIEPRSTRPIGTKPLTNLVQVDPVGGASASLKESDFEPGTTGRKEFSTNSAPNANFKGAFAPGNPALNPTDPSVLVSTLRTEPKDKHSINAGVENMPSNASNPAIPYGSIALELPRIDHEFLASQNSPSGTISTMRLADLLLPLGIGPEHNPGATGDEEWLTLGEALAIALDYSSPPATSVFGVWNRAGGSDPSNTVFPKLDRGNLVLDDFVPYLDVLPAGPFDPQTDRRGGLGVPLALGILDRFHVHGATLGGLTKATPGLVNINTAPLNVLRTVPMLSPTQQPNEWWDGTTPGLPQPGTSDLAATVVGYRDKVATATRLNEAIHFENSLPDDAYTPLNWDGREQTAVIPGLREQPGLASIGEMMAMVDRTTSGSPRISNSGDAFDYAVNETTPGNSSLLGVASSLYKKPAGLTNELVDEFAEKLAVLSAASNVTTTRSDYFACWFVLHGYREGDCINLSNAKGDPLVPTIARRYLMVIDRSNVTRRGEKPRVLVFTELPL
jgi:hypothetical protein